MLDKLIFGKVRVGSTHGAQGLTPPRQNPVVAFTLGLDVASTPYAVAYLASVAHISFRW
jgi:hypothetical protein